MINTSRAPVLTTMLVWIAIANLVAFGNDQPKLEPTVEVAEFVGDAAEYRISVAKKNGEAESAELVRKPILNWSNPVRNNGRGAYFVWTLEGRPMVVGTIMTHPLVRDPSQSVIRHEFHSLASGNIEAMYEGKTVWSPTGAGVTWTQLDVASPDPDERRRFRGMKALARRVTAQAVVGEEMVKLRLLPNPLFRYKSESGAIVEGALFAFVTGTDPEVLLLIEARQGDEGLRWHVACARQTSYELKVKYPNGSNWTAPKIDNYANRSGTFISLRMKVFPAE